MYFAYSQVFIFYSVPAGGKERRSTTRPSRGEQTKSPPASSKACHPPTSSTRARSHEEEKERRKQQKAKEKKETQVKGDQTGRVEVRVKERTEEKVRSTVVDVDSVRATGGGGEEDEEKEEEQRRWLLETDRQDGELSF